MMSSVAAATIVDGGDRRLGGHRNLSTHGHEPVPTGGHRLADAIARGDASGREERRLSDGLGAVALRGIPAR